MAIAEASADRKRERTIFVVDDEHVITQTLSIILQKNGFHAVPFTNPLHALEAARTETPDLLISDVMMPDMSGIDLAIAFRALCPGCKVLLFSGQSTANDPLKAARDQGHTFRLLTKPVHPTDLLAAIQAPPTAAGLAL